MSKFEVGDLVKGLPGSNAYYSITNENMTKGVVKKITENGIVVKVLEHVKGRTGVHVVDEKYFEKIGHLEPFDRKYQRFAVTYSDGIWGDKDGVPMRESIFGEGGTVVGNIFDNPEVLKGE